MLPSESNLVNRIRKAPINYALLKLIHHEFGNGLAVLSGYRQLLHRATSARAQESFPPTQDVWQDRNERELGYLRRMQDREMHLQKLLAQLRALSPEATDEPLCRDFARADLVVLLGQVIEQLVPLCPDCALHVSMPAQPLFIRCDPFWVRVLFEHVLFNYPLVGYPDTVPAEIHLESFSNDLGREAQITLRLRSDLPGCTSGREREFEALIRQLEQDELEACLALIHKILYEHGGRLWSGQEGSISLALPLAEERKERL